MSERDVTSAREWTQVDLVKGLIRIEDVRASVARRALATGLLDRGEEALAAQVRAHSLARSDALRTQLEALGGGLDGPQPLELAGEPVLDELAAARDGRALLAVLARLERVAIDTAARWLGHFEVPELVQTVASGLGAHAQHLAALRLALGEDPV